MKIVMDILFFVVIIFYTYRFVLLLIKLKENKIFPLSSEEIDSIKKYPDKKLFEPSYAGQRLAILINSVLLVFVTVMFVLGAFYSLFNWTLYLLFLLPIVNSYQLFNLFTVLEGGILSGSQFIRWGRIKSFKFIPIHIDHRFYGFSEAVNDGYELKIKMNVMTSTSFVTTEESKDKLEGILKRHLENKK